MSTASRYAAAGGCLAVLAALTYGLAKPNAPLELRQGPYKVPAGLPFLNLGPSVPTSDELALGLTASGKPVRPPGPAAQDVDFEGPSGQLTVTVKDPWGRPYDVDNRVLIKRIDDGVIVAWSKRYHRSPWFQATLAPGSYQAIATSDESVPRCSSGWHPDLAPYGRAVSAFEVTAGQRTAIDLQLFRGGRVRLALPIEELPQDPLAAAALAMEKHASNAFGAALQGPGGGAVELVSTADGARYPVRFYAPALDFLYRYDVILPGTDCLTHSMFPPGEYLLKADIPGYEPAQATVQILTDETAQVTLQLTQD